MNQIKSTPSKNGTINYISLRSLLIESFDKNKDLGFYGKISQKNLNTKHIFSKKNNNNKEYQWKKYSEVYNEINIIINSLYKKFPYILNEFSYIGLLSKNAYESLLLVLGGMITSSYGITTFYQNIDDEDIFNSLCKESNTKIICVDQEGFKKLNTFYLKSKNFTYSSIIIYDNQNFNKNQLITNNEYQQLIDNINIINFSDLLFNENIEAKDIIQKSYFYNNHLVKNFNINCLTSNKFKLCHFTDQDLIETINDLNNFECFRFNELDIYYMINSLSDITEIIFLLKIIFSGSKLTFCTDFSNFFSEIEILHPTLLNTYPIVWKKIYTCIQNIINSLNQEQKAFINTAIKVKMSGQEEHCIWDKVLFDKIKNKFGTKIRHAFTSNNLLNFSICQFLELSLKTKMIIIYGLTETCGFVSINENNDGSIGKLLNSRKISLCKCEKVGLYTEIPIEGYTKNSYIKDSCGEIVVTLSYNNKEIFSGDYVITVLRDNQACYFYIEKIENFLEINQKLISPLHFEISHNETFDGAVNNLFLSKIEGTNELVIVAHLVSKKINSNNDENPENKYTKLITEILSEITQKPKIKLQQNEYPTKVYILENNHKIFNSKMNINRNLLKKEVTHYYNIKESLLSTNNNK